MVEAPRFALAHALLASLPAGEVVTTNYDGLFERASAAAERPTAVLPYRPDRKATRGLLKLNCSVDHPEDIAFTREDYLKYSEQRGALSAIARSASGGYRLLGRSSYYASTTASVD